MMEPHRESGPAAAGAGGIQVGLEAACTGAAAGLDGNEAAPPHWFWLASVTGLVVGRELAATEATVARWEEEEDGVPWVGTAAAVAMGLLGRWVGNKPRKLLARLGTRRADTGAWLPETVADTGEQATTQQSWRSAPGTTSEERRMVPLVRPPERWCVDVWRAARVDSPPADDKQNALLPELTALCSFREKNLLSEFCTERPPTCVRVMFSPHASAGTMYLRTASSSPLEVVLQVTRGSCRLCSSADKNARLLSYSVCSPVTSAETVCAIDMPILCGSSGAPSRGVKSAAWGKHVTARHDG